MRLTEKDEARFWSKVALPNEQGCMLWMGAKDINGYGRFNLSGRAVLAHRVSYVIAYGPIPDGLEVDHVKANGCTNRHCVAPLLHLEAVTSGENTRRGEAGRATGAQQRSKTHCPQGHPYAGENLVIHPGGDRGCRECKRAQCRAYRQRQRAA